ncbi:MAG: DUF488 domain-containing protein [Acidiferrobacteraceae bacterium]
MISLRRIYDPPIRGEGKRFVVDRLWPRGVAKERVGRHRWIPDAAPSTELRTWFGHDPARWGAFRRRYIEELKHRPEAVAPLVRAARRHAIVLLYAAADRVHNNAVVLREYVSMCLGSGARGPAAPRVSRKRRLPG